MAPSTLQDRLRSLLAGMPRGSQAALARACGVKGPSVSDWLNGRTKELSGEHLLRAARFFNVAPEWLATGRGPIERLSGGDDSVNRLLGETVTSGLPAPPSHSVTLDPLTLVEAEKWVMIEEGPLVTRPDGTRGPKFPYGLIPRAERLAAIYAMAAANGGTVSLADAKKLIEAAEARLTQAGGEDAGTKIDRRAAAG